MRVTAGAALVATAVAGIGAALWTGRLATAAPLATSPTWADVASDGTAAAVVDAASASDPVHSQATPNIVFILVDDLGWGDVGFMGSDYYETPNIDRLASAGLVFTNAYSNGPNCAPSRASLMSGEYTPRHGIYTVTPSNRGDPKERKFELRETETELELGIVTVAEALASRGYTTASMGKWHLGGEAHAPTDQGFDVNVAGNDWGMPQSYFWPYERQRGEQLVRIPGLQEGGAEGEYLTDRLTDEALRWIEANAARPFFLYLSHYAVHTPIEAKAELAQKYAAKKGSNGQQNPEYAAMIESVDDSVGRVVEKLDELGIVDDTVVIFFSDNGGLGTVTSQAPLRGAKGMLYEGGIRVPLVVRWPGHVEPGTSTDVPVIGSDFYPTLLDISGAAAPDQPLDGLSMMPLLAGEATESLAERPLFWHFPAYLEAGGMIGPWRITPAAAVRLGNFKLIEFFEDGRLELYDLAGDVGEAHDLSASMPDKTRELHELMQTWRESVGAYVPSELNPAYDPGR